MMSRYYLLCENFLFKQLQSERKMIFRLGNICYRGNIVENIKNNKQCSYTEIIFRKN